MSTCQRVDGSDESLCVLATSDWGPSETAGSVTWLEPSGMPRDVPKKIVRRGLLRIPAGSNDWPTSQWRQTSLSGSAGDSRSFQPWRAAERAWTMPLALGSVFSNKCCCVRACRSIIFRVRVLEGSSGSRRAVPETPKARKSTRQPVASGAKSSSTTICERAGSSSRFGLSGFGG
jgi:hypothetical protein